MRKIATFERFSPGPAPTMPRQRPYDIPPPPPRPTPRRYPAMSPQPATEPAPAPTRTPTPTPTPAPPPRPEPPKKPDIDRPTRIPQPEHPENPVGKGGKIMGFDRFAAKGTGRTKVDETDVAERFISEMAKKGQSVKKFMEKR